MDKSTEVSTKAVKYFKQAISKIVYSSDRNKILVTIKSKPDLVPLGTIYFVPKGTKHYELYLATTIKSLMGQIK